MERLLIPSPMSSVMMTVWCRIAPARPTSCKKTDEGKSITCVVHAVDGAAEEADSAASNAVGPVDPCLTLTVGKGNITPKVDLEEGDTLTGTATVLQAVNPVETHVWELDGSEIQRGNSATYVADAGVVRYRKEVTDDNNVSAVIGEWSDPVTVAEVLRPTRNQTPTMHGSAV